MVDTRAPLNEATAAPGGLAAGAEPGEKVLFAPTKGAKLTAALETSSTTSPSKRLVAFTRTTPGRLRVATVCVAILAVAAGTVASLTMLSRSHAAESARTTVEPLVVDAQGVDIEMSEANTTIAGGFLSGPVVPAAVQSRFEGDLAQASADLTAASQRAGTDLKISAALQTLTTGLPVYAGIVAAAEANNRLQYPVASAYLGEANNLMQTTLLPAASTLYTIEDARLAHADGQATSDGPVVAVAVLLFAVLVALVGMQLGLNRRFRRVLNVGCVVATALLLAVGLWLVIALNAEDGAVARAEHHGSAPLGALTRTRILAQQARADDELTLVTRDADVPPGQSGPPDIYQNDFENVSTQLNHLISEPASRWTGSEKQAQARAAAVWDNYGISHDTVRADDLDGNLPVAIKQDQSTSASQADSLDAALATGVGDAVSSFNRSARAATNDLDLLPWVCLALVVGVVACLVAGVEPRLKEYR